jgi:hypothetical protein
VRGRRSTSTSSDERTLRPSRVAPRRRAFASGSLPLSRRSRTQPYVRRLLPTCERGQRERRTKADFAFLLLWPSLLSLCPIPNRCSTPFQFDLNNLISIPTLHRSEKSAESSSRRARPSTATSPERATTCKSTPSCSSEEVDVRICQVLSASYISPARPFSKDSLQMYEEGEGVQKGSYVVVGSEQVQGHPRSS